MAWHPDIHHVSRPMQRPQDLPPHSRSPDHTVFRAANILFHLLLPEYGYHRDEMYYMAIADGFSFSNLDMPPVSPLYLKLFLVLFGHSLKVVHLAASVCGSLVIVFSCLIAKELGGRRYAMILTGTFLLFSGIVIFGSLYTYDDVSFVLWAAVLYLITRMLNGADQRLWLLAGSCWGSAADQTDHPVPRAGNLRIPLDDPAAEVVQAAVDLAGGACRPSLGHPLCSLAMVAWLVFSLLREHLCRKNTHASPVLEFLWHQLLPNNLATLPVWLTGLIMLLFRKPWAAYRFLASAISSSVWPFFPGRAVLFHDPHVRRSDCCRLGGH